MAGRKRDGQQPRPPGEHPIGPGPFAATLDRLFRAAGEPSLRDVAAAITAAAGAAGGPTISATYLWLLRTGQKANPTLDHLTALAAHFAVPPAYFFDDGLAAAVTGDVEGRAALRDPGVRALALRAAGLSPRARRALAELADHLPSLPG